VQPTITPAGDGVFQIHRAEKTQPVRPPTVAAKRPTTGSHLFPGPASKSATRRAQRFRTEALTSGRKRDRDLALVVTR
jgi:hypothetical protein